MRLSILNELTQTLEQYSQWLTTKGLSPHTRRNYESRIDSFFAFLAIDGWFSLNYQSINSAAKSFKEHLKGTGAKPSSINAHLCAIKSLCEFLGIPAPTVVPEPLIVHRHAAPDEAAMERLIHQVETRTTPLEKILFFIMLGTGIGPAECVRMNITDICIDQDGVFVQTEKQWGNLKKLVRINLHPAASRAMAQWICERTKRVAVGESALFVNRFGERLTAGGVDCLLRNVGRLANITLSARRLALVANNHQANSVDPPFKTDPTAATTNSITTHSLFTAFNAPVEVC